jgi:nucleotide-binding universal stress UspA family protein
MPEPFASLEEVHVGALRERRIVIGIARERGAAVVVAGSHGSQGCAPACSEASLGKLIEHCDRPVLVIRGDSH